MLLAILILITSYKLSVSQFLPPDKVIGKLETNGEFDGARTDMLASAMDRELVG